MAAARAAPRGLKAGYVENSACAFAVVGTLPRDDRLGNHGSQKCRFN